MDYSKREDPPSGFKQLLYFTNWACYARKSYVNSIPFDQAPYLDFSYCFYDVLADGSVKSLDMYADEDKRYTTASESIGAPDDWNSATGVYGNIGQFLKAKKAGKKFNVGMSIGGWSKSGQFSPAVKTAATRENLVNNILFWIKKYNLFSSVSIDWEYISSNGMNYGLGGNKTDPADEKNCLEFVKLLRKKLDAAGKKHVLISMAVTADPTKLFNIKAFVPYIDEVHSMTYDFSSSSWGAGITTHHTNLYPAAHTAFSADVAIKHLLSVGVPSKKILLGAAMYSRGHYKSEGLGKPQSGEVVPQKSWEDGVVDYKDLPQPGAVEYWDNVAKATYSYDASKKIFNSYDDVKSIKAKCEYVKQHNLKGIIWWEFSGDHPYSHPRSLIRAANEVFSNGAPAKPVTPVKPPTPSKPSTPAKPPTPAKPSTPSKPVTPVKPPTPPKPSSSSAWKEGVSYSVGSKVSYNGANYVCTIAHTSISSWDPVGAVSLWQKI